MIQQNLKRLRRPGRFSVHKLSSRLCQGSKRMCPGAELNQSRLLSSAGMGLFLNIKNSERHSQIYIYVHMYIDIEKDPHSVLFILRKSQEWRPFQNLMTRYSSSLNKSHMQNVFSIFFLPFRVQY